FLSTILSLGLLGGKTGNVFGSWNALGIFAGFFCLMFLLVIGFFPISRSEKIFLEILILISIFLVAALNFPLVWILLGVSGLIIFVYQTSTTFRSNTEEREKKHFPTISFVIVIISLLFFLSGQFIGNVIPNRLEINNTEIGPSFSSTMSVTR